MHVTLKFKFVLFTCTVLVFCNTTMGLVTNLLFFTLAQNFLDCMKIINDFY